MANFSHLVEVQSSLRGLPSVHTPNYNKVNNTEPASKAAIARRSLASIVSAFNDTSRCESCAKPVYHGPELTEVDGKRFHNWCFRCQSCSTKLSACTGNYRMENNRAFCHICFDKLCNPQKVNYPLRNPEATKLTKRNDSLAWEETPAPSLISGWLDQPKPKQPKATARRTSDVTATSPVEPVEDMGDSYGFSDFSSNPFINAGVDDGVEIWRMENGNAVQKFNIPSRDKPVDNIGVHAFSGTLFQGDVYIMLNALTKPSRKRFAEIFIWVGKDANPDDENMALDLMTTFKDEIEPVFKMSVAHRRIKQNAEGPFFKKFQEAYSKASPKNFQIQYREGGFAVAADNIAAQRAAAAVFQPRLIQVHISNPSTVVVEEVPCNEFSMTNNSVFLLETFGKVYQYNGIKCKPIERFEGRAKFQQIAKDLENEIESNRPSTIDYEIVMQTRNENSLSEQRFFDAMSGDSEPWSPMSVSEKERAYTEAHSSVSKQGSKYDGNKWTVRDSTVYNHSTSFFGGLNAAGPGRNKGRSG